MRHGAGSGLRSALRGVAYRHLGGTAVVLVYHRVAVLERDPQMLAVSPANFEAQMRMLSERFQVIPLHRLVDALTSRKVPSRAVAVTFDDGYADNLLAATPVLRSAGVPATVFVTSGNVDSGREFWWDELERVVLAPGVLPARIDLQADSGPCFSAALSEDVTYTAEDARQADGWNVTQPAGDERQRLYTELCAFIKPLAPSDRDAVLARLRGLAGVEECARETHRPLTRDEVRELDASGIVEVGGHTVTHPVLSAVSEDEQYEEIVADRHRLGELCGRAPRLFSYPFGGLDDFGSRTAEIVREAGYAGACANNPAVVKPWTDAFAVPRDLVRDRDAETLARRIEGWFDEPR